MVSDTFNKSGDELIISNVLVLFWIFLKLSNASIYVCCNITLFLLEFGSTDSSSSISNAPEF